MILNILVVISNFILVCLTAAYVFFTYKLLTNSISQLKTLYNPLIGVQLNGLNRGIEGHPDGQDDALFADLTLTNMGNAPAIDVYVDGEITLEYTKLKEHSILPAADVNLYYPFIEQGKKENETTALVFGDLLIPEIYQDSKVQQSFKYNLDKKCPKLSVYVYYKNLHGQYYKVVSETYVSCGIHSDIGTYESIISRVHEPGSVPQNDGGNIQNAVYDFIPLVRPRGTFNTYLIDEKTMKNEISQRDSNRGLSYTVVRRTE